MKSLLLASALALATLAPAPLQAEPPNLLSNGNLKSGMEGWRASVSGNAVGEVKITPDGPNEGVSALQVSVTTAGENFWDVNAQITGFAIEQGKAYVLTLAAKSEPAADLIFVVLSDTEPAKPLAQQKGFMVREDWDEYAFHFVAEASAPKARIYISKMNRSDTTFWFANASLNAEE